MDFHYAMRCSGGAELALCLSDYREPDNGNFAPVGPVNLRRVRSMNNVYCQFIDGQFGEITSLGMAMMAKAARSERFETDEFQYQQVSQALDRLVSKKNRGRKVVVVGYSLGAGTAGLLSQHVALDLLIALDPSRAGINYKAGKDTKRSVLIHNNNWLSKLSSIGGAGEAGDPGGDLGFQVKIEVDENHLLVDVDSRVQSIVLQELKQLAGR